MSIVSRVPQVLESIKISTVWAALGGGPLRKGRAPAFWRDGDGYSVSLDDDKGAWFDFRDGIGGGILDLIEKARSCDRKEAVRWLADFAGVPLSGRPFSPEERRAYVRRRAAAEREARVLIVWRDDLLALLRASRDNFLSAYHRAKSYVIRHGLDSFYGELAADVCDFYEVRYLELDRQISQFVNAPFSVLRELRRKIRRAA